MDLDPILLKIDIHVRYTVLHVCNNRLFKYTIGSCKFLQSLQKSQT